MHNWIKRNTVLRTSVTVIVFIAIAATSLSGQSAVPVHRAFVTTEGPFAGIDQSLASTADALIASSTPPVVANINAKEGSAATPRADPRILPWSAPGLGSSVVRVELLSPPVEPVLESYGVPAGLAAAVMFVESGGRADALSAKGARGLWQLMPDTARRYGLRVDETRDDRLDLAKATNAAAQYLQDLHAMFGDWKLALAAYNTGEANVSAAIRKGHSQNFDRLADLGMLSQETRDYVPKVLARMSFLGPIPANKEIGRSTGTTIFAMNSQ